MIIAALTGSLAMGKTETARMFATNGIPVFDSDEEVHRLYAAGGAAVPVIGVAFPGCVKNGKVDRVRLADIVLNDRKALEKLESLVHPFVEDARARFIDESRRKQEKLVILDVPLLFESGLDRKVDKVIVVTADPELQRRRALARKGMTLSKFEAILARQVPDGEKRCKADFIVDSSRGFEDAAAQVRQIVSQLIRDAG